MVVQKQQLMVMPFERLWARMLPVSMLIAQYPPILLYESIFIDRTSPTKDTAS